MDPEAFRREAHRVADWIADFTVMAPAPFGVVCFRANMSDERNEQLLDRVNASGEVFLSHTRLNGQFVIRLAIGNLRTTEAHVTRVRTLIQHHAHELSPH